MASGFVIRKNQYFDSVFLMSINKRLAEIKGVQKTAVLMGSEKNKQLIAELGFRDSQIEAAQANDLIVAVVAETEQAVKNAIDRLDELLQSSLEGVTRSHLHTLEEGLREKPNANLAVISVPGEYAGQEALKALEAGLHTFIFSSNVSIEDEIALKQFGLKKGLIVMGPDCGTSLIGGVGIGFANVIRRGNIGVIGAAGTGLQEFTSQVHNAGFGISHAIGTGTHDPSDEVGGITTLMALDALETDPSTKVIVFISKPFGKQTFYRLLNRVERCKKPVVGCFLGLDNPPENIPAHMRLASTIDEVVQLAIGQISDKPISGFGFTVEEEMRLWAERARWSPEQRYLRGLFAGGTLCYQAQQILRMAGIPVYSNAPLDRQYRLANPNLSVEHTLVDLGDDYYTLGKPHPMIDGTIRRQRILQEGQDPEMAILLLDFILGFNASTDPVGEVLDAIIEAQELARRRGGNLTVVASICGTDQDPQDRAMQKQLLEQAGIITFDSGAKAASFCAKLLMSG